MIIIIHSDKNESTIQQSLGKPEYSYYFVLKEFRPVLEKIGKVIVVDNPEKEVDVIYKASTQRGEHCVFLSFAPPNKTPINFQCPTFPVFAWEFYHIPTQTWDEDPRNDWRFVLGKLGWAITHSNFAVKITQKDLRPDFPIVSIPAPVWDRFNQHCSFRGNLPHTQEFELVVDGMIVDSSTIDLTQYGPHFKAQPTSDIMDSPTTRIKLGGIVYTSIFNPIDGRKNWLDILWTFCWAFRDIEDATLVFKFTHHDISDSLNTLLNDLYKLSPFSCRVVMIHGYLSDEEYDKLTVGSTYTVNASRGEGQCLPLMEYMSAGKPAIAPKHTGMEDYINKDNAFLVRTSLEPTMWPHDPRQAYRTLRHRVDWESLLEAFKASYQVAAHQPKKYRRMSLNANKQLRNHCSQKTVIKRLRDLFAIHRKVQIAFTKNTSTDSPL